MVYWLPKATTDASISAYNVYITTKPFTGPFTNAIVRVATCAIVSLVKILLTATGRGIDPGEVTGWQPKVLGYTIGHFSQSNR